jgi:hypothetical protein
VGSEPDGRTLAEMRAWWVYWIAIAVGAVIWLGAILVVGRDGFRSLLTQPLWLVVLVAPLVVAGADLIVYRTTHEEVCRLEARRHGWLRAMVGDGYSARTFTWTGVALLVVAGLIVAWAAGVVG